MAVLCENNGEVKGHGVIVRCSDAFLDGRGQHRVDELLALNDKKAVCHDAQTFTLLLLQYY